MTRPHRRSATGDHLAVADAELDVARADRFADRRQLSPEPQRRQQAAGAGRRIRGLDADPGGQRAAEQAAKGRRPEQGDGVEGHHPAALVVVDDGLDDRVGGDDLVHQAVAGRGHQPHRQPQPARHAQQDAADAEDRDRRGHQPAKPDHRAAQHQPHRARQRTDTRRRHQEPERVRPAAERSSGDERCQHGVGSAQHADGGQEDQQAANRRRLHDVAPPLGQLGPEASGGRWALVGGQPHRQQPPDHRDIAEAVDQEAVALADRGHQAAGDGRAEQPRAVEVRRVQRDGVTQVGAVVDHPHHERLPGGNLDRVDDALEHRQPDDPRHVDVAAQGQGRQRQRLRHRQHLGGDEHLVAIPAVEPDPGQRRQDERRRLTGKTHQAEQERRIGEPVDQPRRGQPGHPRADERDPLADEEQPVVAGAERAERRTQGAAPANSPTGRALGLPPARGLHRPLHRGQRTAARRSRCRLARE